MNWFLNLIPSTRYVIENWRKPNIQYFRLLKDDFPSGKRFLTKMLSSYLKLT